MAKRAAVSSPPPRQQPHHHLCLLPTQPTTQGPVWTPQPSASQSLLDHLSLSPVPRPTPTCGVNQLHSP